jgi:hypothetical protein
LRTETISSTRRRRRRRGRWSSVYFPLLCQEKGENNGVKMIHVL